jgi:hypothetical protein
MCINIISYRNTKLLELKSTDKTKSVIFSSLRLETIKHFMIATWLTFLGALVGLLLSSTLTADSGPEETLGIDMFLITISLIGFICGVFSSIVNLVGKSSKK